MTRQILLTCLLLLSAVLTQAQTAISTAGGEGSGSGGQLSYTIGQTAYKTNTAANGTLAEGVQQAYEVSEVEGIAEVDLKIDISVYPNPTSDYLQLKVGDRPEGISLEYQLYDVKGKLIQTETLNQPVKPIAMSQLEPATYFIRVVSAKEAQLVKQFKVIKK